MPKVTSEAKIGSKSLRVMSYRVCKWNRIDLFLLDLSGVESSLLGLVAGMCKLEMSFVARCVE